METKEDNNVYINVKIRKDDCKFPINEDYGPLNWRKWFSWIGVQPVRYYVLEFATCPE